MHGMKFTRGMLIGAALGMAVAIAFDPISKSDRRKIKRRACRCLRNAEDVMDSVISKIR